MAKPIADAAMKNQQTYNFAAMVNSYLYLYLYLYILMVYFLLAAMAHLLRTMRRSAR